MKIAVFRRKAVIVSLFLLAVSCRGGELMVGGGYGKQVGQDVLPQKNAVIDVIYDFYRIDRDPWCLSCGAGVSWLWNDFNHQDVLIASFIPTLRLHFAESVNYKPYLFVSTGFSYMTEPQLGRQLLGGYFAFNDYFGIGTYVGRERNWSMNLCWRHISNAGIFEPNLGIDVPFCLLIGRRF